MGYQNDDDMRKRLDELGAPNFLTGKNCGSMETERYKAGKVIAAEKKKRADRHEIEHTMLPSIVHKPGGRQIIRTIMKEKGNFFVKLFQELNKMDETYHCPYKSEQFVVERFHGIGAGKGMKQMVRVTMPKPEEPPLCTRLYFCCKPLFGKIRYITIEKGMVRDMLCEWGSDGSHMNYGPVSETEEDERKRVWEIV